MKILISVNSAWNLVNFRSGLVRALIEEGFDVTTLVPKDVYIDRLVDLGCSFVPISIDNKGTNPGRDLLLLWRFYRLLRRERPNLYLGFTIKPNIYGSLAAHALGIPVINNITGLGTLFINNSRVLGLVRKLYRISLSRSAKIFFQNHDDLQLFVSSGLVAKAVADQIPGSGINLVRFVLTPLPCKPVIRFLLIARMLWDKGIGEFVSAARILKLRGIAADFCLLGFLDVQNPTAISRKQIDVWVEEGVIRYLGVSDDVRIEIKEADCLVLPSYREGTPRTLLEAAAMGRPIIATNVAGCRDVVNDGASGYLCQPMDALDLAEKMADMAALSPIERAEMGRQGRVKMECEFDERIVIDRYLDAIKSALNS